MGEVVLSGPGSGDEELVESLGVHLGLPVRVAWPLGGLDTSGLALERGSAPLHRGGRTLARSGGMRPVNLLPQEAAPAPRRRARRQLLRGRRRARRAAPDGARLRGRVEPGDLAHATTPPRRTPRPRASSRRPPRKAAFANFAQIKQQRLAERQLGRARPASTGSASCASSRGSCPSAAGSRPPTLRRVRRSRPAPGPTSAAAATGAAVADRQPRGLHARAVGHGHDDGPPRASSTASSDVKLNESARRGRSAADAGRPRPPSTAAAATTSSTSRSRSARPRPRLRPRVEPPRVPASLGGGS